MYTQDQLKADITLDVMSTLIDIYIYMYIYIYIFKMQICIDFLTGIT